jgi:hypothetical protein
MSGYLGAITGTHRMTFSIENRLVRCAITDPDALASNDDAHPAGVQTGVDAVRVDSLLVSLDYVLLVRSP